jgi:hypothetical protein
MAKVPKSKLLNFRKIILITWPFLLAMLVFLGVRIAIRHSTFVESVYSERIYPVIAATSSYLSRYFPFSLWDIFWILIILAMLIALVLVIIKKIKFGWYILRILQLVALLYSCFYISWGYNYFRPNIEKRLKWEKPPAEEKLFRSVLDTLIAETNKNYTSSTSADYPEFDKLIEESYLRNAPELDIAYPNGTRRPKTMIFSSFFSKVGVSGYFGPFFNEIHLNSYNLPMDYPFVLAHEKAHQFGFTSESEANLVAFVICIKSEDKRVRYSGFQSLLLYLLKDASRMKDYKDFISKIDTVVIKDFHMRQKYYQGLENKNLSRVQTKANDIYLKANKVDKGVKNYNQVVSLVTCWYYNSVMKNGGTKTGRSSPF